MKLPSYGWRFAHLAALWGYGVSQPVFSMLQGNPEFLVVHGTPRVDVVIFALVLTFGPPFVVVAVAATASRVSRALDETVYIVGFVAFGFLAGLQLLRLFEPRPLALTIPAILAILLGLLYLRSWTLRAFLAVSIALPVIGLLSFVSTVPLAVDDRRGADIDVATSTPVVLIVLDELPTSSLLAADGSIDGRRYPNFMRLARDGTWYSRATTVHEFTTHAVPSILTGRLPVQGDLPRLADHPNNLFTLLGEAYQFHVREPVTRLCPSRYCPDARAIPALRDRYRRLFYDVGVGYLYQVLPRSMERWLPTIGDRWSALDEGVGTRELLLRARDVSDVAVAFQRAHAAPRGEFARFLEAIESDNQPATLYVLHLMLPHSPWRLLPSGREYGNASAIDGIYDTAANRWEGSGWLINQALQRHLLQVGYTDRLVGTLIRRLERNGVYDRALVILTADHGVSFRPGGSRRQATSENIADVAAVPLFIKYPGQRKAGVVDQGDAKTIDILPTIADVLGVRLPWPVDGRSLRGRRVARPVTVMKLSGDTISRDGDTVAASVAATARRNSSLFGDGSDTFYRIGPHKELLGQSLVRFPRRHVRGAVVRFDGAALYANVRMASGFIPARVVGAIEGRSLPHGTDLAVSVNGRIAATTESFTLDGRSRFSALVPEDVFRNGLNNVEVHLVEMSGSAIRLLRLGGTIGLSPYEIAADDRSIRLPTGQSVRVVAGRLDGRVEASVVESGTLRLRGWAADLRVGSRVNQVVLFSASHPLYASETHIARWDVEETSHTELLRDVGWAAEIPMRDVQDGDLRVFAIRGDVASELDWAATTLQQSFASRVKGG